MTFLLLKNKTILYAEDDKILQESVAELLKMLCKKVLIAKDGKEAYELYELESPDIVISDIKMPNMDGLKLLEKIRQNNYTIPFILLTAYNEQALIFNAANLSIDGYILKPFEFHNIVDTITRAMNRIVEKSGLITVGKDIFYNTHKKEIYKNGSLVILGEKEHELFKLLLKNQSKTVTKEDIFQILWPFETKCDSTLKTLVHRIRKKISEEIILSIRGIGYRIESYNL